VGGHGEVVRDVVVPRPHALEEGIQVGLRDRLIAHRPEEPGRVQHVPQVLACADRIGAAVHVDERPVHVLDDLETHGRTSA
jgi:hypothetical protein